MPSQAMNLIDEARYDRNIALTQANQWQYIATLLTLELREAGCLSGHSTGAQIRWTKTKRDVGRHYLVPEEMKAGTLKVTLMEAPEQGETDAAI